MTTIEQTRKEHSPRKIEPKQPTREGKVVEDTIQSVRKELEDSVKAIKPLLNRFVSIIFLKLDEGEVEELNRAFKSYKLEGFNLGVSLAQKEFLQIIDKLYPLCICEGDDVDKNCPNEWVEDWSDNINRELKQSLEVKDEKI